MYDFLDVVSAAYGKESTTNCLGEEIDDIMPEDDTGVCSSPELDFNSEKPVFEDIDEFRDISEKDLPGKSDGWVAKSTSGTGGAWDKVSFGKGEESTWGTNGAWDKASSGTERAEESTWGTNGAWDNAPSCTTGLDSEDDCSKSSGWNAKSIGMKTTTDSTWGTHGAWGKASSSTTRVEVDSEDDRSKSIGWNVRSSQKTTTENAWGGCNREKSDNDSPSTKPNDSGWGSGFDSGKKDQQGWNARSSGMKTTTENAWLGWTKEKSENDVPSAKPNDSDWGSVSDSRNAWSGWTKGKSENGAPSAKPNDSGWVSVSDSGKKGEQPLPDQGNEPCGWDEKVTSTKTAPGWSSSNEGWTKNANSSPTVEQPADTPVVNNSWGKQMSPEASQGVEFSQPASSVAWLSPKVSEGSERQHSQWGKQGGESFQKGHGERSGGWGSDAEGWKIKKNRPSKLPGGNEDSSSTRLFTATRQRLDMFTSEEQDALSLVEPIMQSIRKIMHQPGYNSNIDSLRLRTSSYLLNAK